MDNKDKVLKVVYKYWRYHCEHKDERESLHEAIIQATLDEEYGEAFAEEIVVYKEDTAGNTYTEVYDGGMDRYRHQHYMNIGSGLKIGKSLKLLGKDKKKSRKSIKNTWIEH